MATYRAAYVPPEPGANGGGLRLTTPEQSILTYVELMLIALQVAAANDVEGDIVIGDWTE